MAEKSQLDKKVFSGLAVLPRGSAAGEISHGCIVLEGGAFRGLYSAGVLDALMQAKINMECTVGVSAGAMNGMNYVAGQIGRTAWINLKYRHDKRYVSLRNMKSDQGIIGFSFLFQGLGGQESFNAGRFFQPDRRFIAVATNCLSGKAVYFEKGKCGSIFQAVRASASMPYCSNMVWIDHIPYLDGGCSDSIPYEWALKQGYQKIIVVRTRTMDYRKKINPFKSWPLEKVMYHAFPKVELALRNRGINYNRQCEELTELAKTGRIFVISPSKDMGVSRLETDVEKLGALYYLGYNDMKTQIEKLKEYLGGQNFLYQ